MKILTRKKMNQIMVHRNSKKKSSMSFIHYNNVETINTYEQRFYHTKFALF